MSRSSELYYCSRRNKVLWFFFLSGILTVTASTPVSATEVDVTEVPELVERPVHALTGAVDLPKTSVGNDFLNQVQLDAATRPSLGCWHYQSAIAVLIQERTCRYLKFRSIPLDILTVLYTALPDPQE